MTAPMTLAKFERDAEDALQPDTPPWALIEALRPLLLRLLAGERERCAQMIGAAASLAYNDATRLRQQNLANQHIMERGDTLEFAEELVRRMEDPT